MSPVEPRDVSDLRCDLEITQKEVEWYSRQLAAQAELTRTYMHLTAEWKRLFWCVAGMGGAFVVVMIVLLGLPCAGYGL